MPPCNKVALRDLLSPKAGPRHPHSPHARPRPTRRRTQPLSPASASPHPNNHAQRRRPDSASGAAGLAVTIYSLSCLRPISCAPVWCGPSATRLAASRKNTLKWMKPGSGDGPAAKAGVSITRFSFPAPWRCVTASREPSSTIGKTVATRDVFVWLSSPTVAPIRSAGIRRKRHRSRVADRHRRLERLCRSSQARLRSPRDRRKRRPGGRRGIPADHPLGLCQPEDLDQRHPSRGQRQASPSLPQRIRIFRIQSAFLSLQRVPLAARNRQRGRRADLSTSFLGGMGAPYI